jgi:hypothetical protein
MGIFRGLSRVSRASANGPVALIIPLREYVAGRMDELAPDNSDLTSYTSRQVTPHTRVNLL